MVFVAKSIGELVGDDVYLFLKYIVSMYWNVSIFFNLIFPRCILMKSKFVHPRTDDITFKTE